MADSKEFVPSLEEVQAPPQPLRRIRRGPAEENLDAAGPAPAFASSTEYLDHVSFINLDSPFLSPRVRGETRTRVYPANSLLC